MIALEKEKKKSALKHAGVCSQTHQLTHTQPGQQANFDQSESSDTDEHTDA